MSQTKPTPSVLVVDDEWINREIMETVLTSAGFRVYLANAPQMALTMAEQYQPDLALIDVRLPHEDDGYKLCRQFRQHPKFASLPIMMITALDDEQERLKALDAGANAFVTRLTSMSSLIEQINKLITG